MAGIDVGIIKDIKLQNGKARVQMVIKSDVPITRSARIEIRPNGILGDKFVEVVAGDVKLSVRFSSDIVIEAFSRGRG